jgi:hypothetical protein
MRSTSSPVRFREAALMAATIILVTISMLIVQHPHLDPFVYRQSYSESMEYELLHSDSIELQSLWLEAERELIVGMAAGIDSKRLCVFLRTLRRHSIARVILLVPEDEMEREAESYSSTFWKKKQKSLLERAAMKWGVEIVTFRREGNSQIMNVQTARFDLMRILLEDEQCRGYLKDIERVITIDVTDAFFQRDPFEVMRAHRPRDENVFFATMEPNLISFINEDWIRMCFNTTIATEMRQYDISCSGASLGTRDAFMNYLRGMSINSRIWFEDLKACLEATGTDQGVHNVLTRKKTMFSKEMRIRDLYTDSIDDMATVIHLHYNERYEPSLGFHVQQLPVTIDFNLKNRVKFDHRSPNFEKGRLYSDEEAVKRLTAIKQPVPFAIVHQYNRLSNLTAQVESEYGMDPDDDEDNRFEMHLLLPRRIQNSQNLDRCHIVLNDWRLVLDGIIRTANIASVVHNHDSDSLNPELKTHNNTHSYTHNNTPSAPTD